MASKAGILQMVVCNAATLTTTPAGVVPIGLRGKANLNIAPHKNITDYKDRDLRNRTLFKATVEAYGLNMKLFKGIYDHKDASCDIQIVTTNQTGSASGEDVFQFISSTSGLGVDFDYVINNDKKSLNLTFERSMGFDAGKTFQDAANSNTQITFSGVNADGIDYGLNRNSDIIAIQCPKDTELFSRNEITERYLSIKTKGKKSLDDVTIVDYLTIELRIKAKTADVTKLVALDALSMSPSIYLKEYTTGGVFFDAFDIAAGFLTITKTVDIGDEDRLVTVTFKGDVPVGNVSFLFGADNGGSATDTDGTSGGTFKVS